MRPQFELFLMAKKATPNQSAITNEKRTYTEGPQSYLLSHFPLGGLFQMQALTRVKDTNLSPPIVEWKYSSWPRCGQRSTRCSFCIFSFMLPQIITEQKCSAGHRMLPANSSINSFPPREAPGSFRTLADAMLAAPSFFCSSPVRWWICTG